MYSGVNVLLDILCPNNFGSVCAGLITHWAEHTQPQDWAASDVCPEGKGKGAGPRPYFEKVITSSSCFPHCDPRLRNDLLRVKWDVNPYTITHSLTRYIIYHCFEMIITANHLTDAETQSSQPNHLLGTGKPYLTATKLQHKNLNNCYKKSN